MTPPSMGATQEDSKIEIRFQKTLADLQKERRDFTKKQRFSAWAEQNFTCEDYAVASSREFGKYRWGRYPAIERAVTEAQSTK